MKDDRADNEVEEGEDREDGMEGDGREAAASLIMAMKSCTDWTIFSHQMLLC